MKTLLRNLLMICILGFSSVNANAEDRLKIVATLSSFADIASAVGGDYVEVISIASPRFNPHFIEPKPSDVLRVKRADLYIHSGLDLEAWGGPLVDAAARPDIRKGGQRQLDLSAGIQLLEVPAGTVSRAEGDIHLFGNPHYWMDPRNGIRISQTILQKLCSLDPTHAEAYTKNQATFESKLQTKIQEWSTLVAPYRGQKLIGYHNEWIYLMQFTGLVMDQFLEPKPGIPPSPGHISELIAYAQKEHIRAIIQPTYYGAEAAQEVAEKSNSQVLSICQNVKETSDVPDYISLIDFDIKKIFEALKHA